MGHLIPAGTGQKKFKDIVVSAPEPVVAEVIEETPEEVPLSEVETKKIKRKVKLVE
jgi:hypothetical protein